MSTLNIAISDDMCWVCGSKNIGSVHHCLSKHLKPIKNITVPVCNKCHKSINATDIKGMIGFLCKLAQNSKEIRNCTIVIKQQLEEYDKNKKEIQSENVREVSSVS